MTVQTTYRTCPRSGLQFEKQAEALMKINAVTAVVALLVGGLLAIGVVTGYLGAAPSIVWASGVLFAAMFIVMVPVAIWIYTLVFAFSSLWFAHFALAALSRLRAEAAPVAAVRPRVDGEARGSGIERDACHLRHAGNAQRPCVAHQGDLVDVDAQLGHEGRSVDSTRPS